MKTTLPSVTKPTAKAAASAGDGAAPEGLKGLPSTQAAEQAIAHLLQPIAQLMIDHGVQLGQAVEQLKRALVQQACRDDTQKESTESRITLLTGVHRKDVKRLRHTDESTTHPNSAIPVHIAVISRWISEPRYLNADQTPRALAKTAVKASAGEPDFSSLVAQVSKDVGARAVLDELIRLGVAHITKDGLIRLNDMSFVPQSEDAALALLASNVRDHLAAAVRNVKPSRTQTALLEQSAFSHSLTAPHAAALHDLARQLWSKALQQFLQAATVAEERSLAALDHEDTLHSVRFGVYFNDDSQAVVPSKATAPRLHHRRNSRPSAPDKQESTS